MFGGCRWRWAHRRTHHGRGDPTIGCAAAGARGEAARLPPAIGRSRGFFDVSSNVNNSAHMSLTIAL